MLRPLQSIGSTSSSVATPAFVDREKGICELRRARSSTQLLPRRRRRVRAFLS
jgi:hypothetical protein